MGRYARDKRPKVKPVEKLQLPEGNIAWRAAAAVLLLLIGAGALTYCVYQLFTPEAGWQAIQAGTSDGPTCGDSFTLLYELGAGEEPAAAENRAVARLYTRACRTAFQLFHTVESFEGVTNLRDINARPNETLAIDPLLYGAFEAVQAAGSRYVYLGPVWARYSSIFTCQDDSQILDFDPWTSPEVAEEYAAIAAYASDPEHIEVELLGEGRVRLSVSEEYLAFAQEEGIDRFLDFGWMENAFIADYLADTLAEAGYTHGVLSSYDGFVRCLDGRDTQFTLSLYGWEGGRPIEAGRAAYQGPRSIIGLRGFPVAEGDWQHFYRLKDGRFRTPYLDVSDGRCRGSADCLVCWSEAAGCAQLALAAAPVFIAGEFRAAPLEALAREGVYAVWCRDRVFSTTDRQLELQNLYQVDGAGYSQAGP